MAYPTIAIKPTLVITEHLAETNSPGLVAAIMRVMGSQASKVSAVGNRGVVENLAAGLARSVQIGLFGVSNATEEPTRPFRVQELNEF
jgi:hypothetical protein